MTSEERDLITGLFDRLRNVNPQQRDAEADRTIQQAVAQQPASPYLLVQTVLVQEHALANAQARIKELERQVAAAAQQQQQPAAPSAGGFLAGLFGGSSSSAAPAGGANIPPQSLPSAATLRSGGGSSSYPATVNLPASAGGGFLRSALTTAAGVAGGAMLFEGIESLLGHRSGAFGSGLGGGGGGFMDTGFGGGGRPEVSETVNNYYGTPGEGEAGGQSLVDDTGDQNPADFQNVDDPGTNNDPGYDAPLDDGGGDGFDPGGSDLGSGDYSSDDSSVV